MKTITDATSIGPMKLKNRLWRSATWLNMADDKGYPSAGLRDVYLKLAAGGIGTIITGYASILEDEQPNPGMLGIYSDDFIPVYRRLTDAVKASGANIVMQICYGGLATDFRPESREIWGPSAVAHPHYRIIPKEMGRMEIETVIEAHVQAARRVKESGFNGVQIHAAHSYLFSQFLSPYFNRRRDEYGGSIENRGRIIFETVKAVRRVVGEDYPLFIKMHATDDWNELGLKPEESLQVALELEKLGISGIEFSGGNPDTPNFKNRGPIRKGVQKEENQSYFADAAADIAEKLSVPVISVGGHRKPERLEQLLETTRISYFSFSRILHSEPDLPARWLAGEWDKPRCIACGQCWSPEGNRCILDR